MKKLDYIPKTNIKMIHQDKSYTFGIDSIILMDFAKMKKNKTLIDIGSGSGILALGANALYQLEKVIAIEIQSAKADQLKENLILNNIENIDVINDDLNNINLEKNNVDYIITNPPYYKIGSNIANDNEEFLISRQEKYLNLDQLFRFSEYSLKPRGSLFMIHKPERMVDIFKSSGKLVPKKIQFVHSRSGKKPEFILIEFVKNANDGLKVLDPIIIYEKNEYTDQIKKISGLS